MSQIVPFKQKVMTVRDGLEKLKPQMARLLPEGLTPDRMVQVALTAIQRQPQLLDCTLYSLTGAILSACELGLQFGILAEAHLVPFKNSKTGKKEVQLIPDYKGLVKLVRQSGELSTISAHVVYQDEKFDIMQGTEQKILHVPAPGPHKDADIIGAYAVARLKEGGIQQEFMWKAEIDAIRARSKAGNSGPWATDYGEMAKKTVIKRLYKLLPKSVRLQKALDLDILAETGESQADVFAEVIDVSAAEEVPEQAETPAETKTPTPTPEPAPPVTKPSQLTAADIEGLRQKEMKARKAYQESLLPES